MANNFPWAGVPFVPQMFSRDSDRCSLFPTVHRLSLLQLVRDGGRSSRSITLDSYSPCFYVLELEVFCTSARIQRAGPPSWKPSPLLSGLLLYHPHHHFICMRMVLYSYIHFSPSLPQVSASLYCHIVSAFLPAPFTQKAGSCFLCPGCSSLPTHSPDWRMS